MDIFPTAAPGPGWLATDPIGGTITWTGCAGFLFDVDDTRIAIDPFVSNPGFVDAFFRPARSDGPRVRRTFERVSAAFVGHSHWDHAMDVGAIARANPDAIVHGSETTAELCRRQGVSSDQVAVVRDGERVTFGPFTIEAVESRHGIVPLAHRFDVAELQGSGMPRTAFRWPKGAVFAYRVEVAGLSFHLHTSAGLEDAPFARQQPVDVLIVCLAARQGTPRYFERLGAQLRPKVVIPCHHDNFLRSLDEPPRAIPKLDWPEFLARVAELTDRYGTRLVQLPRGVAVQF